MYCRIRLFGSTETQTKPQSTATSYAVVVFGFGHLNFVNLNFSLKAFKKNQKPNSQATSPHSPG